MIKQAMVAAAMLVIALGWQTSVSAQTLASSMGIFTYPQQDQAPEQQSRDDYECFTYAKSQTGYDPMNPTQVVVAVDDPESGSRATGAVRGAAGGAVIGAVAGDTGKGAAIGATLGLMRGGQKSRNQQAQAEQQAEQQAQQQMAGMENGFRNAYGACIEARGYSVKF